MESATVQGVVWSVNYAEGYAIVIVDNVYTYVYPVDGALPQVGQRITLVRNGGDLVPIASSQRVTGTIRGAMEAEAFVGVSNTLADVWENDFVWTPLNSSTELAQPTEGVDPPLMRMTRRNTNGKVQASTLIPLTDDDYRYIALELSAPAASTTGRDCYAKLEWMFNATVTATYIYHLDNLFADPLSIQSPPLFPPPFTTHARITVYSEALGLIPGAFMDVRLRAWTVPVFQGGAVLDLDGNVLIDHRGVLINGYPVNGAARSIPLIGGTGVPGGTTTPVDANIINFPAFSAANSSLRWEWLTGTRVHIKLTVAVTGAAPASAGMWFRVPFVSRDHEVMGAQYHDSGVAWHMGQARIDKNVDEVYLAHVNPAANNGNVDEANPFTFGNGDMIIVTGSYEVAP